MSSDQLKEVRSARHLSPPKGVPILESLADMDLRMLRVFCAIVEAGGFTATQARRGSSGFQLTDQDQELFEAAKLLFAGTERFRQHANGARPRTREQLQIGSVDSLISRPYATPVPDPSPFASTPAQGTTEPAPNAPR